MNLNKLLISFRSLESREKLLLKIVLALVPLLFFVTYYLQLSESINHNTRNATLAKSNFEYVQSKALNFQAYAESQEALLSFPEPNSFMINESQTFKFNDFTIILLFLDDLIILKIVSKYFKECLPFFLR